MSEVLVSGKVDTEVEKTANRYITATGTTQDAIIKCIWGYIADTGNVPLTKESSECFLTSEQHFNLGSKDPNFCQDGDSSPIKRMHALQKRTHTNSFMRSLDEKGVKAELEKRMPVE